VQLLLVMVGGALGSALRYLSGRWVLAWLGPALPWGTLFVNLCGGFLMGVLAGTLARAGGAGVVGSESARLLLGVGVLGGFTTFSAFSLDAVLLWERGQAGLAGLYVLASVLGSIAALAGGLGLVRAATA
jgi:CrcB protein